MSSELLDPSQEPAMVLDAGSALAALNRSEIDIQVATARRYPRDLHRFKVNAMAMATADEETAASMFYVLPPRAGSDGKRIEGPSVRLAEVVASCWGNLRYGARVVGIDDEFLTAQGVCHDLETNNAVTFEVKRRITKKDGKRFSADMIQVTANAAGAIAMRQAVFKVVPGAFVKPIYEASRRTSIGEAKSMGDKRRAAIDFFKKAGATEKQVLEVLGKSDPEQITDDDLITLRGLATAIKDGDTTIEEALGLNGKAGSKVAASPLADILKKPAAANGNGHTPPEPAPDTNDQTIDPLAEFEPQFAGCRTVSDFNALEKHWLDIVSTNEQAEWITNRCNRGRESIKATRGERSNKPEQKQLDVGQTTHP